MFSIHYHWWHESTYFESDRAQNRIFLDAAWKTSVRLTGTVLHNAQLSLSYGHPLRSFRAIWRFYDRSWSITAKRFYELRCFAAAEASLTATLVSDETIKLFILLQVF
ncbi:hypothetical protein TcWFU_008524 [Taenia crassiceps]|uniref:Uncharacterized protein n=1 Tax=Taenia crassiceps TaxID=6207 RepID=A0ABR4QMN7_9CEST